MPNANVSMIETGASVDNVRRMTKGEIDFGLVMADTSIQALAGTGPFQGKAVEDLAAHYVDDIVTLQLVVRAGSGVATLKDLQGKKFSAGIRGSGAELLTRQMFRLLGIEPQWSTGSMQEAIEGTQNRQLAVYSKYGVGTGLDDTLRELMVSTQMRYLSFGDQQRAAILAKIKGVDFAEIPANTIPGQAAVTTPIVFGLHADARRRGKSASTQAGSAPCLATPGARECGDEAGRRCNLFGQAKQGRERASYPKCGNSIELYPAATSPANGHWRRAHDTAIRRST